MDFVEVGLTHLKLTGTGGEEVGNGERLAEVRDKESGKRKIEGKDGFDAVSHVEGRVASELSSGCTIGPEDEGRESWPL